MARYLTNAFSLNMIGNKTGMFIVQNADLKTLREISDLQSVIGHQATADLLTELLGRKIEFNRVALELKSGDILYVVTVFKNGKPFRLPEGKVLTKEELKGLELKIKVIQFVSDNQKEM